MDKTSHTVIRRSFLIEGLPEPLTPASSHLQLFDNYIPNTRLRIRNLRVPETKEWRHVLQQIFPVGDQGRVSISSIDLNDPEYAFFARFEGREIRKNRYFHEFGGREFTFDAYLGPLWGLTIAKVEFRSADHSEDLEPPPFAVFEITGNGFFRGDNLVEKRFEDVREEVGKIDRMMPHQPLGSME